MGKGFIHISALLAFFFVFLPCHGKKRDTSVPYLETRIDRNHTVEGGRLIYEVLLVSPDPDVAGAEVIADPQFPGLNIGRSAPDSHLMEIKKDGNLYYCAVIDRFFVGTDNKGKFTIKGGDYRVGINRRVTIEDPFWGPSMANRVEMFALSAPDLKIQVDPLPVKNRPDNFSGAVGKFEIELSLKEKPVVGEEICMVVTIVGLGDLTDARLPDLPNSFGDGLHFKSMTDSESHFIKQGSIGSEVEIECRFTADKPGHYVISPIEFCFFDCDLGKYITIESNPLDVEVSESSPSIEAPPVIMDV